MCCNGIIVLLALIIGFGAIIYLIYQTYSYIRCGCGKYGPFVSTYGKVKEDILNEARAVLKKSKKKLKVTDLGCGSGALLIPLAKEFPQHEFIGYEWDIVPLTMGKIKASGLKNITFIKGDYMKASHAEMDLIMCYVLKVTGEPLGAKLAKEIKPSCVVISEMFPLAHLKETKQIASSIYGVPTTIFVYEKPAEKKTLGKKTVISPKVKEAVKETATKANSEANKSVVKGKSLVKKPTPKTKSVAKKSAPKAVKKVVKKQEK